MNIDEMSDQEKSVLLARAMGLEIEPQFAHPHDIFIKIPSEWDYEWELLEGDFYTAPMEISWRVLNWASEQMPKETSPPGMVVHTWAGRLHSFWGESHWVGKSKLFIHSMPPADAQRLWLDKILELAIEAGLVEVEHA